MNGKVTASIGKHFEDLTDPRRREPTYPLQDMITMALCAVISGADDFVAIADFAVENKDWFGTFLNVSNGTRRAKQIRRTQNAVKQGFGNSKFSHLARLLSSVVTGHWLTFGAEHVLPAPAMAHHAGCPSDDELTVTTPSWNWLPCQR